MAPFIFELVNPIFMFQDNMPRKVLALGHDEGQTLNAIMSSVVNSKSGPLIETRIERKVIAEKK